MVKSRGHLPKLQNIRLQEKIWLLISVEIILVVGVVFFVGDVVGLMRYVIGIIHGVH